MKQKSEIEVDKNLKLIAKSSGIVFIGFFLSKLFTYFYRVVIARNFGSEVYGLFSLAITISSVFIAIAALGLVEGLVRYISLYRGKNKPEKIKYVFSLTLFTSLISSAIFSLIFFLSSNFLAVNIFHNSELVIFLKIFSLVPFLMVLFGVFSSALRAFEKIFWYSFATNIFQNLLKILFLVLLIFTGLNSGAVSMSYVLSIFGALVLSYYVCKHQVPWIFKKSTLKTEEKRQIKGEIMKYSLPLMFLGIFSFLFNNLDSLALGFFRNASEVGIYSTAIITVSMVWFTQELFMQLFLPLVTKEFSKGNFLLVKEISKQVGKWIFAVNLPISIIVILFPNAIINILFGSQFIAAGPVLRILAVGQLIFSLGSLLTNLILITGRSRWVLINLIVVSLINLILEIVLVPHYGLLGAALAATISMSLLSLILFVEVKYLLSMTPLRKTMVRIFLVSIIPALALFYIRKIIPLNLVSMIFMVLMFFLTYFLLLYLTKCLDKKDILILKSIKKKLINWPHSPFSG
jgi:O-antigen/teichoic acid export membrane protein